jgi:hypothetical protein
MRYSIRIITGPRSAECSLETVGSAQWPEGVRSTALAAGSRKRRAIRVASARAADATVRAVAMSVRLASTPQSRLPAVMAPWKTSR